MTDLDAIVQKYGKTKVIMGSKVDCRTLTFGSKEQIKAEIDATLEIAKDCPWFSFSLWAIIFPAIFQSTMLCIITIIYLLTGIDNRWMLEYKERAAQWAARYFSLLW